MKNLLAIALLSISFSAYSQTLNQKNEKIYISLDKPYHAAGEDLLYSIFMVNHVSHQLSSNVAVIYIDLLNPYGQTLLSQVLHTQNGREQGVFTLPDTLSGGIYELVAYTNAMAGSSSVSFKKVTIDGPNKLRKHKRNPVIKFHPEGGKLITGIDNTIGLMLYNEVGEPIQSSGVVKNEKEQIVAKFTTSANGVGSFKLSPDQSVYWSEVLINGTTIRTRLANSEEGIALHVDAGMDSLRLRLMSTPSRYGKKIKIRIVSRGVINLETSAVLNPNGIRIKIPNSTILSGIALIEIINNRDQVELKRFAYIEDQAKINADVSIQEKIANTRQNVNVCLKVKSDTAALEGNYSVSAFNFEFSAPDWQNMKQYLLFDSELGYSSHRNLLTSIYNQATDRDNFLLSISPDSLSTYSAFNSSQSPLNVITGQLLGQNNEPIGDTVIIASIIGLNQPHPILLFEKTDKNGKFKIVLPPIQTNFTVFVKAKDVDENLSHIKYNIVNQKNPTAITPASLSTKRFELGRINGYYKVVSENNLFETQYETKSVKKIEAPEGDFASYAFSSFDASYELNDYIPVGTLREIAIDIIPGLVIQNTKNGLSIRVKYKMQHSEKFDRPFKENAFVLVDGIPVFNTKIIEAIPVSDMVRIEVAYASYVFGQTKVYGVLSITTKSKSTLIRQDLNHFKHTSIGFPSKTRFEFPSYKNKLSQSRNIPDFRNLLYFNHAIKTNANGESCFTLSTSDSEGNYRIFIEGITASGELVSAQTDLTVTNNK